MISPNLVINGQGTIWLTYVDCSGSESKLLNCTYNTDTSQCHHYTDVGVNCFLSCPTEDQDNILYILLNLFMNTSNLINI